jgi:hypothetical protein
LQNESRSRSRNVLQERKQDPVIRTYTRLQKQLQLKQHKKSIDKSVNFRENPKRSVTHFESPLRRRLRDAEEGILRTLDGKLSGHGMF